MRLVICSFIMGLLLGWSLAVHFARPPVAQFILKPRDVPIIQIPQHGLADMRTPL